jgi:hypothetical protein
VSYSHRSSRIQTIMSTMNEPAGGDVDRGRTASIIVMVQISVAVLIVAARFYARYMIKNLGKDDWCMLFTLVSC